MIGKQKGSLVREKFEVLFTEIETRENIWEKCNAFDLRYVQVLEGYPVMCSAGGY